MIAVLVGMSDVVHGYGHGAWPSRDDA